MALASLRFQRNAQDYEESRQGMTVFAGDARLVSRVAISSSDQEVVMHTAKVVGALRGEALSCAMEIGLAKLMEANGLDLLVQKCRNGSFRSEQRKLVSC